MTRYIALALVAVTLCGVLVFVYRPMGAPAAAAAPVRMPATRASEAGDTGEAPLPLAPEELASDERDPAEPEPLFSVPAGDRNAAESPEEEQPPFEVIVVDHASGAPVAGALVHRFPGHLADSEEVRDFVEMEGICIELVHRYSDAFATDERGIARVRNFSEEDEVFASHGDRWGYLDEKVPPAQVELQTMSVIQVRITDARGRPAIGLRAGGFLHESELGIFLTARAEAPAAIARLLFPPDMDGNPIFVRPIAYLATPIEVRVETESPPSSPIELRLPALGDVAVEVSTPSGQEFEGWYEVELARVTAEGESVFALPNRRGRGRSRALFRHVEIGQELAAKVTFRAVGGEPSELIGRGPGPQSAGDLAILRVVLPRELPVLTGRAVDEDGEPLARTELELLWLEQTGGEIRLIRAPCTTDATGHYGLTLFTPPSVTDLRALVLECAAPGRGTYLATPLRPGSNRLPDLVLRPPSLFVAGTVVDEQGLPIQRALVQLDGDRPPKLEHALGARTDEAGRFELCGFVQGDGVKLLASHEGFPATQIRRAAIGDLSVRIELQRE